MASASSTPALSAPRPLQTKTSLKRKLLEVAIEKMDSDMAMVDNFVSTFYKFKRTEQEDQEVFSEFLDAVNAIPDEGDRIVKFGRVYASLDRTIEDMEEKHINQPELADGSEEEEQQSEESPN